MDKRLSKIKIILPDNWTQIDNPNGPPTFVDDSLDEPGVLQISTAEYLSGQIPNPSTQDLINLSEKLGTENEFGTIVQKQSGDCVYGTFGRVDFSKNKFPLISVWHLSDGKNFIFATFICSTNPSQKELKDVQTILMTITKRSSFFNWVNIGKS